MGAALLVLLGLGLFVAGVLTGGTAFYWACVAACLGAAVPALRRAAADGRGSQTRRTGSPGESGDRPEGAEATDGGPAAATRRRRTAACRACEHMAGVRRRASRAAAKNLPDPPVEEVEVTDLLLVVDLKDEVLVVDEQPRYHLAGCVHLRGRTPIPLPLDEARPTASRRAPSARPTGTSPSRCGPARPPATPEGCSGTGARHPEARPRRPLDAVPLRRPHRRAPRTASTSAAICSACSPSAVTSGSASSPSAVHHSSMRSLTSSPLFLRASCTSRTTSRTSPARSSSGVRVRSSATVRPPPLATVQPSRGVSVTIRSPSSSGTAAPSTSTVAVPAR